MSSYRLRTIIVAHDFSETAEAAMEAALDFAFRSGAVLHVFHGLETHSFPFSLSQLFSDQTKGFEKKWEEKAREKFQALVASLEPRLPGRIKAHFEQGRFHKSILTLAEKLSADLLILGAHGTGGIQQFLVGSNTVKVIMNAPCPVISVHKGGSRLPIRNILIPIDHSSVSRQKVRYATEIARLTGATVHIIGVSSVNEEEMHRKMERRVQQVGDYLGDHGVTFGTKIVQGSQLSQITLDQSLVIQADLIVIMTEQEGSGLFLGNAAQHVINHSTTPVMTVRPDKENPDTISVGY